MTRPGRDLTGKRGQAGARAQYLLCHMRAKGYGILGGEKGPAPSLAPQTGPILKWDSHPYSSNRGDKSEVRADRLFQSGLSLRALIYNVGVRTAPALQGCGGD